MTTTSMCRYGLSALLLCAVVALGTVDAVADSHRSTATKTMKVESATTPKRATKRRVTMPPDAPRYKCEDGECVCKGVLDCKALLDSGFCDGKTFWEDGEDSSTGGCG